MICKNCNEDLNGKKNFCSSCGQKNIEKLNLKYLLSEIVENVLNLDSKMFTSLRGLIFKPGFLSKEFMLGRRIRYVLPVRFYIIISILFFLLVSIIRFIPSDEPESDKVNTSFSFGDKEITVSKEKYKELVLNDNIDSYIADSLDIKDGFSHFFVKQTIKAQNSDGSFGDVLLNQLSIFLLLFIPLISLVYKWSFTNNKYGFVDHVIFNVHFNTFVIFLLIINEFFKLVSESSWGVLIIILGSTLYLFFAIKRFYERKWWVTIYKLFFLFTGYFSLAIVFAILLILVSIIMN
jgi:hypothetical protein